MEQVRLYVLDTDHVSLFQREHPQVVSKIRETPPALLAVTIITVEEQLRGRLAQIKRFSHKTSPPEALFKAFAELRKTMHFFNSIKVLDFDIASDAQFKILHQHKIRVSTNDLRIAAVVLATDNILVTRNRHDFEQIPGLAIEDWSQMSLSS